MTTFLCAGETRYASRMANYLVTNWDDSTKTIEADRFEVEEHAVSFYKGDEVVFFSKDVISIEVRKKPMGIGIDYAGVRDAYVEAGQHSA